MAHIRLNHCTFTFLIATLSLPSKKYLEIESAAKKEDFHLVSLSECFANQR